MSNIRFASPEHRDFFLRMMGEARKNDCYHRAFFYVMGIAPETRANILLPGGFVLLRVCPLLYGGHKNPLPGILPGIAACKKAGGTGPIIRLNGGMNHGRIGSCPAGTPADH